MRFQIEAARRIDDSTIIHPTAEVSEEATIGPGCRIWHQAQVRERARIGRNCILDKGVYVDFDVVIGDHVKIENGCFLYHVRVYAGMEAVELVAVADPDEASSRKATHSYRLNLRTERESVC